MPLVAFATRRSEWLRVTTGASADRAVCVVVFGAHLVLYSADAEADRRFLAESIGLDSVDAPDTAG